GVLGTGEQRMGLQPPVADPTRQLRALVEKLERLFGPSLVERDVGKRAERLRPTRSARVESETLLAQRSRERPVARAMRFDRAADEHVACTGPIAQLAKRFERLRVPVRSLLELADAVGHAAADAEQP